MGLVKDEEPEGCVLEHAEVLSSGHEVFELMNICQQDPGRRLLHLLLCQPFLEWSDSDVRMPFVLPLVIGYLFPSFPVLHLLDIHQLRRVFGCSSDVHTEGDSRSRQEVSEAVQLVCGEGIHGVNDDCRYARSGIFIPELEAVVQYRIQKSFGFPGPGSGGYETVPPGSHGIEHRLLVCEHVGVFRYFVHHWVYLSLAGENFEGSPLSEGTGQRNVWPLNELRLLSHSRKHLPSLSGQFGIGEGESCELVS